MTHIYRGGAEDYEVDESATMRTPFTNQTFEFAITPQQKIVLDDGTTCEKLHLLKGPTEGFDKGPRGIMVMVEDPRHWDYAG